MNYQAYLIAAHDQFDLLLKLLKAIDYEYNDIFIHIDIKSKEYDEEKIRNAVKKSNVFFIARRSVSWGGFSQIQLTYDLLDMACQTKKYSYVHYISGKDFPLKSSEYIYNFFEQNKGTEYVSFDNPVYEDAKYTDRIKYYWLFQEASGKNFNILDYILVKIQKLFRVNRVKDINFNLQKCSNWFSITGDLAEYVLSKKQLVDKYFKYSKCADEFIIQTIVENSEFKNNVYAGGIDDGNLRMINWSRGVKGKPYIWKKEDKDMLLSTHHLWARKFDTNVDYEIINILIKRIKASND